MALADFPKPPRPPAAILEVLASKEYHRGPLSDKQYPSDRWSQSPYPESSRCTSPTSSDGGGNFLRVFFELSNRIIELLNPRSSLLNCSISTADDSAHTAHIPALAPPPIMSSNSDLESRRTQQNQQRKPTPTRQLFPDLGSAHSSIVGGARVVSLESGEKGGKQDPDTVVADTALGGDSIALQDIAKIRNRASSQSDAESGPRPGARQRLRVSSLSTLPSHPSFSTVGGIVDRYGRSSCERSDVAVIDRFKAERPIGIAISEEDDWMRHIGLTQEDPFAIAEFAYQGSGLRCNGPGQAPDVRLPSVPEEAFELKAPRRAPIQSSSMSYENTRSLLRLRSELDTECAGYAEQKQPDYSAPAPLNAVSGAETLMDKVDEALKLWSVPEEEVDRFAGLRSARDHGDVWFGERISPSPEKVTYGEVGGRLKPSKAPLPADEGEDHESNAECHEHQGSDSWNKRIAVTEPQQKTARIHRVEDRNSKAVLERDEFIGTSPDTRHFRSQRELSGATRRNLPELPSDQSLFTSTRPVSPWGPLKTGVTGPAYELETLPPTSSNSHVTGERDTPHVLTQRQEEVQVLQVARGSLRPQRAGQAQSQNLTLSRRTKDLTQTSSSPFFSSPPLFRSSSASPAQQSSTLLHSRHRPTMATAMCSSDEIESSPMPSSPSFGRESQLEVQTTVDPAVKGVSSDIEEAMEGTQYPECYLHNFELC